MTRATGLFACAVAAALLIGHLLRDTPGYVVRGADGQYEGDITHYVYWTRLVTLNGIQSAYAGTWPETYAVYPPVTLYPYQLVGSVYRALEDPSFDAQRAQGSAWLHEAIKGVALAWHVASAVALYVLVSRLRSAALACAAGALYVLNPAALYDVAHWGQPDGAHSLFSVLAVGSLSLGWLAPAWAAMALAALAKPQAWSILPVFVLATARMSLARADVWRALARGAGAAGAVALAVVLPFVVGGRLGDLLTLPRTISTVMPVVTADAHNAWWLMLQARGMDPVFVPDATPVLGPLSYRVLAGALVVLAIGGTGWLYWTARVTLAEAAALGVLGWFVFTTQAHENHLFFALPLLALAWPSRPALLTPYVALSLTVLLNMLLHDQLVLEGFGLKLDSSLVHQLRLLNAALNVACWVVWFAWAAVRARRVAPVGVRYSDRAGLGRPVLSREVS